MFTTLHPAGRARAFRVLAALSLAWLAFSGCGRSPVVTAPRDVLDGVTPFSVQDDPLASDVIRNGSRMPYRYPLAVGHRWDYVIRARVVTIPDAGEPTSVSHRSPWLVEVTGTETRGAHEYFVVQEGDPRSAAPTMPRFYQRQDDDGFYELDVPAMASEVAPADAPLADRIDLRALDASLAGRAHHASLARAARQVVAKLERIQRGIAATPLGSAGAEPDELTFLRYPLQVGSEWTVRESPFFGRVVTGQEELALPVGRLRAWRIRLVSELYDPDDHVVFWYGRPGLVRTRIHAEADAVDDTGKVIGRAVADFEQLLVRVSRSAGPS